MNWDAIGAAAELLGGIATIATLAYLAMQIRQATAATRAEIRQSMADSQIQYLNSRAIDPFLRGATHNMLLGSELDGEERLGFRIHLIAHLRLFENYFSQYRLGTLDREDWRAQRQLLSGFLRLEEYRQAYSVIADAYGGAWNAGFAAEVEQILSEASREPEDSA